MGQSACESPEDQCLGEPVEIPGTSLIAKPLGTAASGVVGIRITGPCGESHEMTIAEADQLQQWLRVFLVMATALEVPKQ